MENIITQALTITLSTQKESNRDYSFTIPFGASYNELYNVLEEFKATVDQMKQAQEEQQKATKEEMNGNVLEPELVTT